MNKKVYFLRIWLDVTFITITNMFLKHDDKLACSAALHCFFLQTQQMQKKKKVLLSFVGSFLAHFKRNLFRFQFFYIPDLTAKVLSLLLCRVGFLLRHHFLLHHIFLCPKPTSEGFLWASEKCFTYIHYFTAVFSVH